MLTIIVSIIGFGFIGTLSLIGLGTILAIVQYWEKAHIISSTFGDRILTTVFLLFLLSSYSLFYLFTVSHFKWSVKKKVAGYIITLISMILVVLLIEVVW